MHPYYTLTDARADSARSLSAAEDRRHAASHRLTGTTCLRHTTTLRHIQLAILASGIVALLSFNGIAIYS